MPIAGKGQEATSATDKTGWIHSLANGCYRNKRGSRAVQVGLVRFARLVEYYSFVRRERFQSASRPLR